MSYSVRTFWPKVAEYETSAESPSASVPPTWTDRISEGPEIGGGSRVTFTW